MNKQFVEQTIKEIQEAFPNVHIYQDASPVESDPDNVFVWISDEERPKWYLCEHLVMVSPGWTKNTLDLLKVLGIAQ